jgi:mannose-1-phosphate guanylyltransferase
MFLSGDFMQAMLLAAGFGTRLRPYTLVRPKPLFPVCNVPLLHILLDMLRDAGVRRVVVNGHHLADQVEDAVADRPEVVFQREPEILGTGGSLRRTLENLSDEPLLVMNGDIYHGIDISSLYAHHLSSPCSVTMAVHDFRRFNTVAVRGDRVCGFSEEDLQPDHELLAFTGIHVLDREVIEQIPGQGFFHIIDLYRELAACGQVGSYRVDGAMWRDIGTPEDYLDLHRELLAGRQDNWCISEQADVAGDARLLDWGAVGAGVKIGAGARLRRCVVWDHAVVADHAVCSDMIICKEEQGVTGRFFKPRMDTDKH